MRCDRPDCRRDEIDDQGFCPACERRPLWAADPDPDQVEEAAAPATVSAAGPVAPAPPEPWWGLELVRADAAPPPEEESPDGAAAAPEGERFCGNCKRPVGRGHGSTPGLVKGFCRKCGHAFDFSARAEPGHWTGGGRVIAGRYEIKQAFEGAEQQGQAYLAYDRNLGTDIVLKDLSRRTAQLGHDERDALVGLRHDSIVRIYGFEPEGPYLVLEHVRGRDLSRSESDRLDVVLGHGLQILQALDYLHERGLLHIDVKPGNIVRFSEPVAGGWRDRVRLIDFGAVWKCGRPGPVAEYTRDYAPPCGDPQRGSPTEVFDLYCLGKTLARLCHRDLRLDPADALDRLLHRAAAKIPERRFVSARQFAEQLSGVIRQVAAAAPGGRRISRPSVLFGPITKPLHGGLGEPRPIGHWSGGEDVPAPFAVPADAAAMLPMPTEDPHDPGPTRECKDSLVACRVALRRSMAGGSGPDLAALDEAGRELRAANLPGWLWIRAWYEGLMALARGDWDSASDCFTKVWDTVPGEVTPMLALGLCAEGGGDLAQACRHYQVVSDTAPALGAGAFGLARAHLLAGRRVDGVAAAERLAEALHDRDLRFEHEARVAMVRLLAAVTPAGPPSEDDLRRAEDLAGGLRLYDADKASLEAEIEYGRYVITGEWISLYDKIIELAKFARSEREYLTIMDAANQLRPPVQLWWQSKFRRIRDRDSISA